MTWPVSPVELLAPRSDIASLAAELARQGRVRVPQLLQPGLAESLHATMTAWRRWALVTRIEGQHRSFDAAAMTELDPTRRAAFEQLVQQEARRGFQYLFERYPLVDHGRTGQLSDAVLLQAFALLRSEGFLELARQLLGAPDIRFADGQLTRYRAGHFLSLHDDEAEGLNRVAAYVINLSADWPAADGGALEFIGPQGELLEAWTPGFNTMSLFRVPAPHRVAVVAADATGTRLSITGWFRRGAEPAVGDGP
jgi:hypothetical protein